MKILSASQPPSPHFPFPPFSPPAHSLAHSRWRKFIKMKLRLQLTGFIKIYLPLTHCAVCLFAPEDKKDLLNNVVTFISRMLWTHECDFSPKIHLLIYFPIFPTFFRTILMLLDVVPLTDFRFFFCFRQENYLNQFILLDQHNISSRITICCKLYNSIIDSSDFVLSFASC